MQCATHPEVETNLACGKCGKPICPRCMVQTPVGARCKSCAQLKRLPVFEVSASHYGIAAFVGLVAALIGGFLWALIPLGGFFTFFIAFGAGWGLGEIIALSVNRKRSLGLQIIAGISFLLGFLVKSSVPGLALVARLNAGPESVPLFLIQVVTGALASIVLNPFAWIVVLIGVLAAGSRLRG